MDFIAKPDVKHAQQLLTASGYDGTTLIVLRAADNSALDKLPGVAAQLLRDAGFKVEMQSMDSATLVSHSARKTGWNIYLSAPPAVDMMNPVSNSKLSGACDKASKGWPCDQEPEKVRDDFARATNDKARMALAEQVQMRAMEIGAYVPLGEYVRAVAARKSVTGFVTGFFTVYWNVEKQ